MVTPDQSGTTLSPTVALRDSLSTAVSQPHIELLLKESISAERTLTERAQTLFKLLAECDSFSLVPTLCEFIGKEAGHGPTKNLQNTLICLDALIRLDSLHMIDIESLKSILTSLAEQAKHSIDDRELGTLLRSIRRAGTQPFGSTSFGVDATDCIISLVESGVLSVDLDVIDALCSPQVLNYFIAFLTLFKGLSVIIPVLQKPAYLTNVRLLLHTFNALQACLPAGIVTSMSDEIDGNMLCSEILRNSEHVLAKKIVMLLSVRLELPCAKDILSKMLSEQDAATAGLAIELAPELGDKDVAELVLKTSSNFQMATHLDNTCVKFEE